MKTLLSALIILASLPAVGATAQEAERRAPTEIRAVGRIVYQNPRGELVGVDDFPVDLVEVAWGADFCGNGRVGLSAHTDEDGYFDFTRTYEPENFLCDGSPDVRIAFGLSGSRTQTAVVVDFPGGTIDFGTLSQGSELGNIRAHLYTVQVRAERWFAEHGYPLVRPLHRSWYKVHISSHLPTSTRITQYRVNVFGEAMKWLHPSDQWNETLSARLFAEEWIDRNSNYWDMDGCNGVCDSERFLAGSGGSCGFCVWCPESATIAWHQGFAAWAASQIVGEFETRYGDVPISHETYEHHQGCASTSQDQWETPGLFAAVLTDISDSRNEHSATTPAFWDALAVGPEPILEVFASTVMNHPVHFFNEFKVAHPEWCSELALTARHNGYVIDDTPPAVVDDLVSTSHTVGVPLSDATVDLDWTAPVDDCESAWQYSIRWGASPQLPNTIAEVRGATRWTTGVIPPGSWYFTIRAADATGNWNGSYDTVGPIIIGEPIPANLAHVSQTGWTSLVTPRENGSASPGNVPLPASLTGDTKSTWWNATVGNTGGDPTGTGTGLWVQADGIGFYNPFDPVDHAASVPNLVASADYEALNLGPITVRGGRHTFGAYNDFTGLVAEDDETDNYWGQQWIWSPMQLAVEGSTSRFGPPARTGGWNGSVSTIWFNSDGVNFPATGTGAGWWNAVTLVANARDADFDARLHVASTGPTNGFASNVGFSGRPADCLDAVFANRNMAGNSTWDAGIIQANDEAALATYEVRHVTSTVEDFGVERMFSLTQFDYMSLHEVWIDAADLGPVSFVVRCLTSEDAPFHVSWLEDAFTTGGMDDYTATDASDETGLARLDTSVTSSGYHCLVVYRDPKDGAIEAEDYIIEIDVTPPDLVPDQPAGWAASIVARGTNDAVPGTVPDPASLPGWSTSTWLNVAIANVGPTTAAPGFDVTVDLDGIVIAPLGTAELPPLT
ncbi:hypothetical protein DRQ32_02420, partial [bacterium]